LALYRLALFLLKGLGNAEKTEKRADNGSPKGAGKALMPLHHYFRKVDMTPEEIKKLIEALKVDGLSEDDAVKLIQESIDASNRGLIQKRDELLANEVKLKDKITALETASGDSAKRVAELDAQLKKNNPDEYKKYYEGQAKELTDKHAAELKLVQADLDKYRESHYTRVRDDAINTAIKDIPFIDGLKDGFIALAMTKNQFKPTEIDGKTVFTNHENKTIEAVLHELKLSNEGKAYIKNGNIGGGASVSGAPKAGSGGGNSMQRSQFDALSDQQKQEFAIKGGTVTDG